MLQSFALWDFPQSASNQKATLPLTLNNTKVVEGLLFSFELENWVPNSHKKKSWNCSFSQRKQGTPLLLASPLRELPETNSSPLEMDGR